MRFVEGLAIREIRRRTGLHRETIRRALASSTPRRYVRPARGSKLDRFKDEVHRLLREDPLIESQRIREILIEQGFDGGKTIVDDYVREVRPFFLDQRTYQRTVYRPGDVLQFDLWQPKREIPVGYGQTRKGYVVVGALGFSRFGAGALVFSKEAPDVLWGMRRCVWRAGALPERFVVDREGCLHAGGGRPTEEFASFCGGLAVGWRILDPGDCEAKGVIERLQGFMETSFEPGRSFANEFDFQDQLDRWFDERANVRQHRTLRERPVDRLAREREALRPLPELRPDLDRRIVLRVPPQPYVHVDRNDYSLDPRLVGRRVEVRVSQREIVAVALDTGELAASHRRVFAAGQEITDAAHQQALERLRLARYRGKPPAGEDVQIRDLADFDRLVA
ncbi:MAG: IS21 family transposase [Solirubrobacteraceae bacterium]